MSQVPDAAGLSRQSYPDNFVNGGFVVQNGELILDAPHGQPIRRTVTSK
jgi:hypothetical protein